MNEIDVRAAGATVDLRELSASEMDGVGGAQNLSPMQFMKLVIDIASGCDVKTTPNGTIYTTCPDTPPGPPQIA